MIEEIIKLLAMASNGDKSKATIILNSAGYVNFTQLKESDSTEQSIFLKELKKKYSSEYVTREINGYKTTRPDRPSKEYTVSDVSFTFPGLDKWMGKDF